MVSDLHALPLMGHDLPPLPKVRAAVFSTSPGHWYWSYETDHGDGPVRSTVYHGPFASQLEAYDSARRTVELL